MEDELAEGAVIVVDVGKTLSKVTLWSDDGRLIDRRVRPNDTLAVDGIRRLDTEGVGAWLMGVLRQFNDHPVEAIVPVGHGAGVVALAGGQTAFAPLDYEQSIPAEVVAEYRAQRDPFPVTGSPALPDGLNIGAQLHWLEQLYPDVMTSAELLPWAQYWAWFLSGAAVSEVTSLGCHSDLWAPAQMDFSPMAKRRGWADRFAPLARAGDIVGVLRPELAAETGLSANVRIHAGLHDSNAALLAARSFPQISGREATVLSTGTWFIAMRSPGERVEPARLLEERDCLVNVDIAGRAVPSARFMGGREVELLGERIDRSGTDGVADVFYSEATVLPSQVRGCGPFPNSFGRWINRPDDPAERAAAIALYAALMTDVSLDLIGARDLLLVEGRFAESEIFVRALAALRPDMKILTTTVEADASFGALRLVLPNLAPPGELTTVEPLSGNLGAYREQWFDDIESFA